MNKYTTGTPQQMYSNDLIEEAVWLISQNLLRFRYTKHTYIRTWEMDRVLIIITRCRALVRINAHYGAYMAVTAGSYHSGIESIWSNTISVGTLNISLYTWYRCSFPIRPIILNTLASQASKTHVANDSIGIYENMNKYTDKFPPICVFKARDLRQRHAT